MKSNKTNFSMICLRTVLFAGTLAFGLTLSAQTQAVRVVKVHVGGMVCSFCAQGLVKTFKSQPGVLKTEVSLDDRILTLYLQENAKLTRSDIADLVKDAGYSVEAIHIPTNASSKDEP